MAASYHRNGERYHNNFASNANQTPPSAMERNTRYGRTTHANNLEYDYKNDYLNSPGSHLDSVSQTGSAYSPNGYSRNYAASESSVASSYQQQPNTQVLDVRRYPLRDSGDSGVFSRRTPSIASYSTTSSYQETDLDSVVTGQSSVVSAPGGGSSSIGDQMDSRYHGELYQPKPAPRSFRQARTMFGEIHPKMLQPQDIPVESSGDEIDDQSSVASLGSTRSNPIAAPRASMRKKKGEANIAFIEDELSDGTQPARGILKRPGSEGSLSSSGKRLNNGKKNVVRFEHVSKQTVNLRDSTHYTENTKKASKDIWGHVAPVSVKPARNDRNRSSGRQSRSSGRQSRSSSQDRSRRSSSKDRSSSKERSSSANGRLNRDRAGSGSSRASSKANTHSSSREDTKSDISDRPREVHKEEVKIMMNGNDNKQQSVMGELKQGTDMQKVCKWVLIIGIPTIVIIAVIGVVVGLVVKS